MIMLIYIRAMNIITEEPESVVFPEHPLAIF